MLVCSGNQHSHTLRWTQVHRRFINPAYFKAEEKYRVSSFFEFALYNTARIMKSVMMTPHGSSGNYCTNTFKHSLKARGYMYHVSEKIQCKVNWTTHISIVVMSIN